jgi:ribonuclease E
VAESIPPAPPAHGRRRGLLTTLRSAAEALVGRPRDHPPARPEEPVPLASPAETAPSPPKPAEAAEPAADADGAARRSRRGRRGGRGRRRNGAEAGTAPLVEEPSAAVEEGAAGPVAAAPRSRRSRRRAAPEPEADAPGE